MKKFEKRFEQAAIVALNLLFPMMALAAVGSSQIQSTITTVQNILNAIIGLLFVLVTLYFIWGIVQYVMASGDETKLKNGKNHMIWGIIGMAVMAGAWGIVRIVVNSLIDRGSTNIPTAPGVGGSI